MVTLCKPRTRGGGGSTIEKWTPFRGWNEWDPHVPPGAASGTVVCVPCDCVCRTHAGEVAPPRQEDPWLHEDKGNVSEADRGGGPVL